jgi:hypothetical protein
MRFEFFSWLDLVIVPFWLMIILLVATLVRNGRYRDDTLARYFLPALYVKLVGGVAVGLVYYYYYRGGDTLEYFFQSTYLQRAFWDNPLNWFNIVLIKDRAGSIQDYNLLIDYLQYIVYSNDYRAFTVVKIVSIGSILGFNSYTACAIILSALSFVGVWSFFRVLVSYYPKLHRELAISILFLPSVVFWGSGILKDSITITMLGILLYCIHKIFILGRVRPWYVLFAFISSYLIFSIKAYILISFIPLAIIWVGLSYVQAIGSPLARTAFAPFIVVVFVVASFQLTTYVSDATDLYAFDKFFETASVISSDLTRDYYYLENRGSRYFIGEIDPSAAGLLLKFPEAVGYALFRPFLWESTSSVMLLAALESTALLLFFLHTLYKVGIWRFLMIVVNSPLLIFMFSFSLFFSFMVGLSSGNYGNLVRYKIPAMPFFLSTLFIARAIYQERLAANQSIQKLVPTLRDKRNQLREQPATLPQS